MAAEAHPPRRAPERRQALQAAQAAHRRTQARRCASRVDPRSHREGRETRHEPDQRWSSRTILHWASTNRQLSNRRPLCSIHGRPGMLHRGVSVVRASPFVLATAGRTFGTFMNAPRRPCFGHNRAADQDRATILARLVEGGRGLVFGVAASPRMFKPFQGSPFDGLRPMACAPSTIYL